MGTLKAIQLAPVKSEFTSFFVSLIVRIMYKFSHLFLSIFCLLLAVPNFILCNDADDYDFEMPSLNYSNWDSDWNETTLIFAQVLFRGGVHSFEEKNKFMNIPNPFPERRGELTKLGKQQVFKLATYMRQRYGFLYNYSYDPFVIRNMAGNINHSIVSALIANAGLYPPTYFHEFWNANLTWNPVPVQIDGLISVSGMYLVVAVPMCNSQTYIIGTKEFRDFSRQHADLIEYMCRKAGISETTFNAFKVASSLGILAYYPEFIQEWMTVEVMDNAIGYYYSFHHMLAGFHSMQRLAGGFLLGNVIDEMLYHLRKHSSRKFISWSVHDDNMIPFLSLLGEIPERWPPYAGAFSVELHRKNDQEYVQIWYWYSWDRPPMRLKVRNCTTDPCTFAEFAEFGKNNPREMYEAECTGHKTPSSSSQEIASMSSASSLGWIIATTIFIVTFILSSLAWLGTRQQLKDKEERIQLVPSKFN